MKIILGPASKALGERISELTGYSKIPVASRIFPDGESYVRLEGSVEAEDVAIVQTTCPPQDARLMQLAFMVAAAKRNGAKKALAVVPYLGYARQDKVFLSGENVSVETVAVMLEAAGIDQLVVVNVHSEAALERFPFPAKSVSAIPMLAEYFVQKGVKGAFALSPDKGAMNISLQAQKVLGGGVGHLEKQRDRYTGQTTQSASHLDVQGKSVIIFDDIISTGGTIVGAAKILRDQGATHVYTACVHGLFIGDAEKRILDAGVEEIVTTDSVPSHLSKVSLAPLISQELKAQT
ncbi:MAG: ribose-phosphate pyrophosphokinase [Candidatus Bathyarchaeota archaeon]|nr:ribose-phosphate pyrophosphokinase [Candidatus Bathyarchaeota archaeon]